MKVLMIAVVMFLFGLFVGILVMPTFNEFSSPLYLEEEYSSPRVKSLLREFGITLPLEASDVNLFYKQDGEKKQVWLKFNCPSEAREAFVEQLNNDNPGQFNREIETPKMQDGSVITWWSYRDSFRYYEFKDLCVSYDELLHTLYLYAVSEKGATPPAPPASSEAAD